MNTLRARAEETVSTVADWFRSTPEGRAIAHQAETAQSAKIFAQRQAWADDLAALDAAELIAIRETHEPAREQASAAVERCDAALTQARADFWATDRAVKLASMETALTRTLLQKALAESASPAIPAFIRELYALVDATAANRRSIETKMIDGKQHVRWTNSASITARLTAIREVVQAAGLLVFEVLDEQTLTQRLEQLRESIPDVESPPAKLLRALEAEEQRAREGQAYAYR